MEDWRIGGLEDWRIGGLEDYWIIEFLEDYWMEYFLVISRFIFSVFEEKRRGPGFTLSQM